MAILLRLRKNWFRISYRRNGYDFSNSYVFGEIENRYWRVLWNIIKRLDEDWIFRWMQLKEDSCLFY